MLERLASHARGTFRSLLTVGILLQIGATGCRESAPDDLIQQENTTDALVFVKTDGEETLNRSWASGNLYKLASDCHSWTTHTSYAAMAKAAAVYSANRRTSRGGFAGRSGRRGVMSAADIY